MKQSATFIAAAAITIFLTGWVIIAHDTSSDFKQLLISITGHHWVSVSLISIVLFLLITGFLLVSSTSIREFLRVDNINIWSTILVAVTLIMMLGILTRLILNFLAE